MHVRMHARTHARTHTHTHTHTRTHTHSHCTQIQDRQTQITISFNWMPVSKELSFVFLLYTNNVTGGAEISTLINVAPFILVVNSQPVWPGGKALGW